MHNLRVQVRLIGLNAGVPWLSNTDCLKYFICKNGIEDASHFFFDCMSLGENFTILWSNLKACMNNILLQQFWSLTDQYPDLVHHLQVQVRLIGLSAGVHWSFNTDCLKYFICKNGIQDADHFFFDCMSFRENFTILWSNLKTTLFNANLLESNLMLSFSENLDQMHKTMFLLGGGLSLPFNSKTTTIVKRFVSIYKIRSGKLRDLEALWLKVR